MYKNIAEKIETYAKVVAWIGIILSVVMGLVMIISGIAGDYADVSIRVAVIITGILVIGLGSLFSWIGGFFVYGYGELIKRAQSIDSKMGSPAEPDQ